MASVLLQNISKFFGPNKIIEDFSLEVKDQEFLVILGPSGCGKTTLLRMIAGLEDISSGTIRIDESIVNNTPPRDRNISMVFQNYALYPHLNVYENLGFALKLRKYPKSEIEKRVYEAAELLEIKELLHKKPATLSGGQRQRVALGRAIVMNPKVFLFDEPMSNLDVALRKNLRKFLKQIHEKLKTTSIYVTHDQQEAMSLADRICVINKGKIEQVGKPIEIYNNPANMFVASFIGSPSMNFFEGKIVAKNDVSEFISEDNTAIKLNSFNGELTPYAGKKVVLGIRPEHIGISPVEDLRTGKMVSEIQSLENYGDSVELLLKNGSGQSFTVKSNLNSDFDINSRVQTVIDSSRIHIFDIDNGKNITN